MQVPLRPVGFQAVMAAGVIVALTSLVVGPGILGSVLDFLSLAAGGMFLFSTMNSTLPVASLTVRLGGTIPDFTATTSDGLPFALSSLRGDPFILKFYRGHW